METKFLEYLDEICKKEHCQVLLQQQLKFNQEDQASDEVFAQKLSETRHFRLPTELFDAAGKIADEITKLQVEWEHGDTSMNNHIWDQYMMPLVNQAATNLPKKNVALGVQKLVGLLLFVINNDEHFMVDQEVYMAEKPFKKFFAQWQKAWKSLLSLSDQELKWDGKDATGLRQNLIEALKRVQRQWNKVSAEFFDEIFANGKCITMFSDAEMEGVQGSDNEDDEDEEEDDEEEEEDDEEEEEDDEEEEEDDEEEEEDDEEEQAALRPAKKARAG